MTSRFPHGKTMHPILARKGRLGLYLVAWVPFALMLTGLFKVVGRVDWREAAILGIPLMVLYAFMCLAAAYPCRSMPISAARLANIVGGQALAAALSATLWLFIANTWVVLLEQFPPFVGMSDRFARLVPTFLIAGVLLYFLAAALHYLVLAFEQAREHEQRHLELELFAREAELKALRAQIDPHFLFNALNSISALTTTDPSGARNMCTLLAELLRESLRIGQKTAIPLVEELALVDKYLAIEKVRYGGRLKLERHIETAAETIDVPPLILQPLVENAVRHGIARLVNGGVIRIEARRQSGALHLSVTNPLDDEGGGSSGEGIGLANVRSRLASLPHGEARCDVKITGGIFRVDLEIAVGATTEDSPLIDEATPARPIVNLKTPLPVGGKVTS
jgi:two-component system sensor histidine kinase AlgZ